MKIWILASEKEFSNYANQRYKNAAHDHDIDLTLVAPEDIEIVVTQGDQRSISYKGDPINIPDCLIPRMGSHTTYYALAIIRQLERLGVLVLNKASSIERAKDKLATLQHLAANKVPLPKTMLAKFPVDMDLVEKEFSYPLIMKAVSGMQGKGVFLCEDRKKLKEFLDLIDLSEDSKLNIIFQEFIATSKGRDIRVFVVGGKAIGAMMRKAKKGDFRANVHAGGSAEKYALTPEAEKLAGRLATLMDLDIAGVDLLLDKSGFTVCEINSGPGFEGFERVTDIDVVEAVIKHIKHRLRPAKK